MKIITEKAEHEITIQLWRGGWNAGFEPECFDDMETCIPYDRDLDAHVMSEADFERTVSWWKNEVANANSGRGGDVLIGLADDEIERGDEWVLGVDGEMLWAAE